MKKLLNARSIYMLRLMIRLAPLGVAGAVVFKGIFLLLQISAIWMMISWIGGIMLPAAKELVQLDDSSYVYLAIAWVMLVCASAAAFFSRWLALRSIKKLEQYVFELTQGEVLIASDYRSLSKVMLSLTDAFVPSIFIGGVVSAWLVTIPELAVPIGFLIVLMGFFFRKGVRFSAAIFKGTGKRASSQKYIGSEEHRNFYQILMVSQYISLAIYTIIATGIVATLILIHTFTDNSQELGLLPVATAIALLQFKSFVSLLVRLGASTSNISRVVRLVIRISS